jgi:Mrp family chromosome partitioning ATPase/DUF971 family protein
MDKESEVLEQLKSIIDPDLGKDIVSLGFVKNLKIDNDGDVTFDLELTTPACPVKEQFRVDCSKAISQLPWVKNVSLTMTSAKGRSALTNAAKGLSKVGNIIAVGSCKGGVGKSTTAVNLAFSLSNKGARVGIFDSDIYGPSLPTLVNAEFDGLFQKNGLIIPVECNGVKLMSFAYASANTGSGPAIMRGPMVTQVINQLLTGTDWGELDYLVVDMPPGTGDTQLTLAQLIPITAAIIVTTPQQLSFVDVEKGIQMFDKMQIPTIAVIENMSYFICDSCDKRHELFGSGSMKKLVDQFGIKNSFTLPLHEEISRLSDLGTPVVLEEPNSPITREFNKIADSIVREVSKLIYGNSKRPQVLFVPDSGVVYVPVNGRESRIHPADLRRECRCARCINEMTGEQILRDDDVSENIVPESIHPMGNYAVAVAWSDGHSSIYPYEMLEKIVA